MPSVVIKPARDRDEYVVWSTVTESPHGYGTREQMVGLLRAGMRGSDEDRSDPETPVRNATHWGSSADARWAKGHWEDESFIYHQAGWLRRGDLFLAAQAMDGDGCREGLIFDLLTPLEDDEEDREHLAYLKREYGDRVVSLESERKMAGLAMSQIKATIESWNR